MIGLRIADDVGIVDVDFGDFRELASSIGCEYVEFVICFINGRKYRVICDEEYHLRERYRLNDPVVQFDDRHIFGPCIILGLGCNRERSLTEEEIQSLSEELTDRIRRIGRQ